MAEEARTDNLPRFANALGTRGSKRWPAWRPGGERITDDTTTFIPACACALILLLAEAGGSVVWDTSLTLDFARAFIPARQGSRHWGLQGPSALEASTVCLEVET